MTSLSSGSASIGKSIRTPVFAGAKRSTIIYPFQLFLAAAAASAVLVPRSDEDPERYTICGGDRGYVEKDSLEVAKYLRDTIVTSDRYFRAKDKCIYATRNTTITSLCNGSARDRHVNGAEVGHGINQLIKDCGLDGGFTAAGREAAVWSRGSSLLAKRDCDLAYDGKYNDSCFEPKHELDDDGNCKGATTDNECKVYCEQKRRWLFGVEAVAPGPGGEAQPAGVNQELTASEEVTVTTGFQTSIEGTIGEIFGAGVGFDSGGSIFPRLIETCGVMTERKYVPGTHGDGNCEGCTPEPDSCGDVTKNDENACSISARRKKNGDAEVTWAFRWEYEDCNALPFEKQTQDNKDLCSKDGKGGNDPDGDGERECYNDPVEDRRRAPFNFRQLRDTVGAMEAF
ncbi:hypothetical protein Micbo1qcDRAFT_173192 [Microdochium bolleyi]|uniref:Uncharacterized protein n=1 Tax=Microdochium bolleyi TaxID=196109 RepID=A0A136JB60_9PEZI|nr:hypothetical protein Micbo1qcDRAFT_173192 [Microdochium bolleyi]